MKHTDVMGNGSDASAVMLGITGFTPVCDACGYHGASMDMDALRDSLGMACPECGAVMITQDDYDKMMYLVHLTGGLTRPDDSTIPLFTVNSGDIMCP